MPDDYSAPMGVQITFANLELGRKEVYFQLYVSALYLSFEVDMRA